MCFGPTELPFALPQEKQIFPSHITLMPSYQSSVEFYTWLNEETNEQFLSHNLDAIDDLHDKAPHGTLPTEGSSELQQEYQVRTFKIGDWVLCRVF